MQKQFFLILTLLSLSFGVGKAQFQDLFDLSNTTGYYPFMNSLTTSPSGDTLYGMSYLGGVNNEGCLFRMNADGTGYLNLLNFDTLKSGAYPTGSLILSGKVLYGMTSENGLSFDSSNFSKNRYGTIFSINTNGTGFKVMHHFNGKDGALPLGSLTLSASDTVLYGMTSQGGQGYPPLHTGYGTLFSINTDSTGYQVLFRFTGISGAYPEGSLTLSADDSILYGMTESGGADNLGCIFSIHTDGTTYTDLHDFHDSTGSNPFGSLTLSGNVLYGTTNDIGVLGNGHIFSLHEDGSGYKTLFGFNGLNGDSPWGSLILSGNILFGMTELGGANTVGNIFAFDTADSSITDLFDFNVDNGSSPSGSLTLSGNTLYGMTELGGANNVGDVFSFTPPGTLSVKQFRQVSNSTLIYPDPASNFIQYSISCSETNLAKVIVSDMLGKIISTENIQLSQGENYFIRDVSCLRSGIYFFQLVPSYGNAMQQKFVIR
jgi:uncharacterized repeat protein (TIGR03803 family)